MRRLSFLFFFFVALDVGAQPIDLLRHTAIFEESVDDVVSEASAVEVAFLRHLQSHGVPLVDEGQARKIRSVTEAGFLIDAKTVPEVITNLDADRIVVAIAKIRSRPSGMLVGTMASCEAVLRAKVLAVDTGAVLGAFDVRGSGVAMTKEGAIASAADEAAGRLAAAIVKNADGRDHLVAVSVSGLPSLDRGRALEAQFSLFSGVSGIRTQQAGLELYRFAVKGPSAGTLASLVGLAPASATVQVVGFTDRQLRLRYIEGEAPVRAALTVVSERLPDIFPSRAGLYEKRPFMVLRLKSREALSVEELSVRGRVRGLGRVYAQASPTGLDGMGGVAIPLMLQAETDAWRTWSERRTLTVDFELQYSVDGRARSQKFERSIVVRSVNALRWDELDSVAAFVTPDSPAVVQLVRSTIAAIPAGAEHDPLAVPVALFQAMVSQGLRYTPDPGSPFSSEGIDHVQYPVSTLESRSGDCDDLSVLYAALAEAAGYRALLVTTPTHVFPAIALQVPPHNTLQLTPHPERFIEHDGRLWLPLETTALGGSFSDAWALASTHVRNSQTTIIDVRKAWKLYATLPPLPASAAARFVVDAAAGSNVTGALDLLRRNHRADVTAAVKKLIGDGADVMHERGLLLSTVGDRFDEAARVFEGLVDDDYRASSALNNLGNLALTGGDLPLAKSRYEAALRAQYSAPHTYYNLAVVAKISGDDEGLRKHVAACLRHGDADLKRQARLLAPSHSEPVLGAQPLRRADGVARGGSWFEWLLYWL